MIDCGVIQDDLLDLVARFDVYSRGSDRSSTGSHSLSLPDNLSLAPLLSLSPPGYSHFVPMVARDQRGTCVVRRDSQKGIREQKMYIIGSLERET